MLPSVPVPKVWSRGVTTLIVALLAPASVAASPPESPSVRGVSLFDDLDPSVTDNLDGSPPRPVPRQRNHTIHLEFGGGSNGNRTTSSACRGAQVAPFGDDAKATAVYQAVVEDWAPFGVTVSNELPAGGTYTTVLIGATNCCGGGLGVAPVICGDEELNATVHVCSQPSYNVNILAAAASQEAAHTYGLMHVDDRDEIMNPYTSGDRRQIFADDCYAYNPGYCSEQKVHCSGNAQNSVQELLAIFGPGVPDNEPPSVTITYPSDGDVFEEGAEFEITADVRDDNVVAQAELLVDGASAGVDGAEPYSWGVQDIGAGVYEIRVDARDQAGNVGSSNIVTFEVQGGNTSASSNGDDSGSDGGSSETGGVDTEGNTGGGGGETEGGGSGPGFDTGPEGPESRGDGCACSAQGAPTQRPSWAAAIIGICVLGAGRRRTPRPH